MRALGTKTRVSHVAAMPTIVLGALAVLVSAAGGCGDEGRIPPALVDGSSARIASTRFESVDGPVILTKEHGAELSTAGATPRTASCLRSRWSGRPASPVVHRIGVSGESVTFPGESGRGLQACDGAGIRDASGAWCGHAFGRLVAGRLRDPRLDVGACRTGDGDPIAFMWVEPLPGARYVVVRRDGFAEAYETGGGLPVRVAATERIDLTDARATFDVSEHTASGRLLRRRELEAVVSG